MGEWLYLHWLNLKVSVKNAIEYGRVVRRFYFRNPRFARDDLALIRQYALRSPYKISREVLTEREEEDVYAYGETPLTTLEIIAAEAAWTEKDHVFELGCGRGRTCAWLHHFVGCRVTGVEFIPEFVEKAERAGIEGVAWKVEDFLKCDYTSATAIYLYGTCLEDDAIAALAERLARLPAGTRIVTVSYALAPYIERPAFRLEKELSLPFTWGNADVYFQVVAGESEKTKDTKDSRTGT